MDKENKYGTLCAQKKLLSLMKEFHQFSLENDIKYSLAYGSLLGAVRHKGFIPWDDDLDIFVDRDNYKKIVELLSDGKELNVERNTKNTLWVDRIRKERSENELKQYIPTIDILVLDSVPENRFTKSIKLVLILLLQGMIKPTLSIKKGSFFLKCCSLITFVLGRLFPSKLKINLYRFVSTINNSKRCREVANYNGEYADLRRCYKKDLMQNIILLPFEDTSFYAVKDWDYCLKKQFGDYMTLPKEEDRRPKHGA